MSSGAPQTPRRECKYESLHADDGTRTSALDGVVQHGHVRRATQRLGYVDPRGAQTTNGGLREKDTN
ncbi:hypothetical protein D4764_17G0004860 [Takifugu flavidus]|uniref:Uncharacterized protein n=1 Tax=Takifugu flavidus TaxID=433684 RepID=A0A5C6NUP1_9TELE|nr:hypothetical protein D4764_17G0004860 [Takifugu flavidus]